MTDINARRTALQNEIDALRRARGAALVDGHKFDGKALLAAETELEALEDMAGEIARRATADADRQQAEARAGLADRFDHVAEQWLTKTEEAEMHARAMVAALKEADAAGAELLPLTRELTGETPVALMLTEQQVRRSRSLSGLLHSHSGTYHYGDIRLPPAIVPIQTPWTEAERKTVAALRLRIRGGQNG